MFDRIIRRVRGSNCDQSTLLSIFLLGMSIGIPAGAQVSGSTRNIPFSELSARRESNTIQSLEMVTSEIRQIRERSRARLNALAQSFALNWQGTRFTESLCREHGASDDVSAELRSLSMEAGHRQNPLLPWMARVWVECGRTVDASQHLALLLETIYWNRVMEEWVPEASLGLETLRLFIDDWAAGFALRLIATNGVADPHSPPDDLLSATSVESSNSLLNRVGAILNLASRGTRAALSDINEVLDRRQGTSILLLTDTLTAMADPEASHLLLSIKANFDDVEANVQRGLILRRTRSGLFHLGVGAAAGNVRAFIRVMATFASVRFWPLEGAASVAARRGQLSPSGILAALQGVRLYFQILALQERSFLPPERRGSEPRYHLATGPGGESSDWKFYHWYVNAWAACKLRERGHDARASVLALTEVAQAYELIHLTRDAPGRQVVGGNTRIDTILEGFDDVRVNRVGAQFGAEVCGS